MNRWAGMILCTALTVGGNLRAQPCGPAGSNTLSGTVLDPSGAAVVGASIVLQAAREETTSGERGSFVLHCVGNDPYQIAVRANGFADTR